MPDINILTESELRDAVKLDLESIECIENAFETLAGGTVVMPPILSLPVEEQNGDVCIKTAYIPGLDSFAIKISPGFFNNSKLGLPSTTGLMVVHSSTTGFVEAVLLDNGYLTDVRTAAAGAVSTKHLARENASSVCVVGAGVQARLQLAAICLIRPIRTATICGRDIEKAQKVASELSEQLNIDVMAGEDLAQAVSSADIIVTTTPSTEPLVKADWLVPGQHIVAMGSDQNYKVELEPECVTKADLFVVDRLQQSQAQGELRYAIEKGVVSVDAHFSELGEVIAGKTPGRESDRDITICDLTGMGVQDTAIANFARQRAEKEGKGTAISS